MKYIYCPDNTYTVVYIRVGVAKNDCILQPWLRVLDGGGNRLHGSRRAGQSSG